MTHTDKHIAVGHIPSGLFIVCAGDEKTGRLDGYLASWIQQVSFDPLMISLAVKPGRPAYDRIMKGDVFTVNIVGDHDTSYVKHFLSGYDPAENPFDKLTIKKGTCGGGILAAAKSAMECKKRSSIKPGDHEVIIADVLSGYVLNNDAKPHVHIRSSGDDY